MELKIAGPPKRMDELPKNLRYLVLIFEVVRVPDDGIEPIETRYIGFIGNSCPICTQFFDGTEPESVFGRIVQLPHLFVSKELAESEIGIRENYDKTFDTINRLYKYQIVPIDIG